MWRDPICASSALFGWAWARAPQAGLLEQFLTHVWAPKLNAVITDSLDRKISQAIRRFGPKRTDGCGAIGLDECIGVYLVAWILPALVWCVCGR